MITKIVIPIIVGLVLTVVQLVAIPFISINGVVPNIVLIYLIFYSLKHGQIAGTFFAFFMGFMYDIASAGMIGSGMFSFTLAAFIAGYFYKEDIYEILQNRKIILMLFMLSSILFFFFYSIFGTDSIRIEDQYSYFIYALLSAFYTTLIALFVYLIPRKVL